MRQYAGVGLKGHITIFFHKISPEIGWLFMGISTACAGGRAFRGCAGASVAPGAQPGRSNPLCFYPVCSHCILPDPLFNPFVSPSAKRWNWLYINDNQKAKFP
jgi:hypothetical protein